MYLFLYLFEPDNNQYELERDDNMFETSNVEIIAYPTHYEIMNYKRGSCKQLEFQLTLIDRKTHARTYYYHYDKETQTLYVPRGFDPNKLREMFNKPIKISEKVNTPDKVSYSMVLEPRNDTQKEAIRFLLGKEEYSYTYGVHQLVLSLPGGVGKTYCMVAAASLLGERMLVVVDKTELSNQWKERACSYTNLSKSSIKIIESSKELFDCTNKVPRTMKNKAIYIMTHALLKSYMKRFGFESLNTAMQNLGVGIKVIDEVHICFENTLLIDYALNIKHNFYLTATFKRTDSVENKIYQDVFYSIYKLRKDSEEIGVKRETKYICHMFNSDASFLALSAMKIRGNFSIYRYIDYELEQGMIVDITIEWLDRLIRKGITKTIFVLSPKKDSCDTLKNVISKRFPDLKVCAYYSQNKDYNIEDYDVVCGTVKMFGTGNDISSLRAMIILEPMGSDVNVDQLVHRVMRGNGIGTTYIIDLVDKSVPNVFNMFRRRRKTVAKYVESITVYDPH